MKKIAFLAIGDEVLDGRVLDRNGAYLGSRLVEVGLHLVGRETVPDDLDVIGAALTRLTARADLVVVSGGLGPTVDDMTCEAVAGWLGVPQQFHPEVWQEIQTRFQARGLDCPATNRVQAYFPVGANLVANHVGTAPGLWVEREGVRVYSFPGVHKEFVAMLDREILPLLDQGGTWIRRGFQTFGYRESSLAQLLEDLPLGEGESLHYQPGFPRVFVLLTASHGDEARLDRVASLIRERIPDAIYSEGAESFPEVVVASLQRHNLTISTAESCTGGLIASYLTSVPGVSSVFREGVITYSNESKFSILGVEQGVLQDHGAVSGPVVVQMAEGILRRSGSDVALATSGIAGPGGGTAEKPVGTVHVALAMAGEATVHHCLNLKGDRQRVQTLAAWSVLDLLRKELKKKFS